jgi:hypothetical protein
MAPAVSSLISRCLTLLVLGLVVPALNGLATTDQSPRLALSRGGALDPLLELTLLRPGVSLLD